jgi:cytochrome c oxidase assembly protein subunit 11
MSQNKKNLRLALNLLMLVAGMAMLAYASVPLYRLFCQQTGFGGTPMIATSFPTEVKDKTLNIRFDTNIDRNLGWEFSTQQRQLTIKVGENGLAFFKAKNPTDKPEYGMAMYNVVPEKAAKYFNKVQCFCFEKQLIKPGEEVQYPVSFFIDPEFVNDPFMDDVDTITLSYTFYEYKDKK